MGCRVTSQPQCRYNLNKPFDRPNREFSYLQQVQTTWWQAYPSAWYPHLQTKRVTFTGEARISITISEVGLPYSQRLTWGEIHHATALYGNTCSF